MRLRFALAGFVAAIVLGAAASAAPTIIPQPTHLEEREGTFTLDANTRILYAVGLQPEAQFLADSLAPAIGFSLGVSGIDAQPDVTNAIILSLNPELANLGDEGYRLVARPGLVRISAPRPAGVFYGIQSLRQLLPAEIFADSVQADIEWTLPAVEIEDTPRFGWRGHLFDVCRHYFDVDTVKRAIDLLALHKMNVLHWHLTEDQGWRIEIMRYPKLTEVGAWRLDADGNPYGGYFTQDDVREIVAYAAARHITVVPEIEMPGHSQAALAAYPHFGCTGGPYEVATTWGIFHDVYCAGSDETLAFLENVLDEVLMLFPSAYIHIGGDECPKTRWKECERCQQRIKDEGLADEHELQSWFVTRMSKYLEARGRRLVGWDEILEGGLAPGAVVQSWRGMRGGIAAANMQHDVIMSPTSHCYLDYSYTSISLEKAYAFEPIPEDLPAELHHHVLGLEGNMWTEWVPNRDRLDYQVYPRLTALAEVAWSPREARNWEDFSRRMETHVERFDILGVKYGTDVDGEAIEGGTTFAQWTPEQMSETPTNIEWDITSQIDRPGKYDFIFYYTRGTAALDIHRVSVLADGREVARDVHRGWSGANKRDIVYRIDLPEYRPGAIYTLRARVASSGGTDSTGEIRIRKPE